jgi:hypothetical protein
MPLRKATPFSSKLHRLGLASAAVRAASLARNQIRAARINNQRSNGGLTALGAGKARTSRDFE